MNTVTEHSNVLLESPFDLLCHYAEAATTESFEHEHQSVDTAHLLFSAGNEFFMLKISDVRSVIRELPLITKLPFSPPWLLGLSNVRSEIVSVVSLSDLLHAEHSENRTEHHYILLGGNGMGYLLRVDDLFGISPIEEDLTDSDKKIIDGELSVEGKVWQRINIAALLKHKLKMDITKFN